MAQFLVRSKRSVVPRPYEGAAVAPLSARPERAGARDDMAPELDRLLVDPWPVLCEGLASNQTQAFAGTLRDIGEAGRRLQLEDHAHGLGLHAERRDVCGLELDLPRFPALVREIRARPEPRRTA